MTPPVPPLAPDRDTLLRALALLPVGVVISDITRPGIPIIYANASAHVMLGLPVDSLVGQSVAVLASTESPPETQERVHDAVFAFQSFQAELCYRRPDGAIVWIDADVRVERDAMGRPLRFVSSHTDVTAKKQAELALRASERTFALALEAGQLGIWDWHVPTGHMELGGAWRGMLGYTKDELEPRIQTWEDLLHPDDMPTIRPIVRDHLEGRTSYYDAEFRLRTKAGEWRWIRARGKVIERTAEGQPVRMMGTHSDVTDLRRTEEELRESRQSLERVMQTSPCSVFVFDLVESRIIYSNHSVGEALGYSIREIEEMGNSVIVRTARPEDLPRIMAFHNSWQGVADGEVKTLEYQARHRDGSDRVFVVRAMVFDRGPDGRPTKVVCASLDITDQRAAAEENRRLDEQLRETQRLESLGVLAGGIAHDFNNLLTGILGYADLAGQELSASAVAQSHLTPIIASAHRAAELCQQMLAYAGKGRVELTVANLSNIVREVRSLLGAAISKKAEVEFDLPDELPGIECDVNQIRQVVMNLFTNASEALEGWPGQIRVSTAAVVADRAALDAMRFGAGRPPGEYVRLTVSDTGCGMSAATVAKMFDPFFTTKFTGRGLGLSAVLGIIRSHGGAIRVDSVEEEGTAVEVLLPASEKPLPGPSLPPAVGPGQGSGVVLVVDDEPVVRRLTGMMLQSLGYTPLFAADGPEAVRVYAENRETLKVVFLDLTMPGLDGLQVFKAIRAQGGRTPVILMSGYSEHEVREKFGTHGFQGFLSKPFTRNALAERLAEVKGL
ncbi:PAS domain-containing hybrid sensor histidine kinase/response regulator [Limnoglobus roseus]|uniref:histidine kinase n=1 Tax=Limnoglobus roseus TaxID=2598579 RepID=A0A5C1A6D4_9BACT|nr:PAS domain-containing hybrid sensor histidine kinase/response regulator [Limnoglobus roseus]QEL13556.1 PAS domain-containing sensor histidine kinase [Limnoglobus roseus]